VIADKALREYAGYDDEQNQQCDDATDKAWRSLLTSADYAD